MRVDWQKVLRDYPFGVSYEDDWEARGSPNWVADGCLWHHTASRPSRPGFPSLHTVVFGRPEENIPGPLCNILVSRTARPTEWCGVRVIASGRANHAGTGLGPAFVTKLRNGIPPLGDAKGPDVVPSHGSDHLVGIEVEGTTNEPWTAREYESVLALGVVLSRHFRWTAGHHAGHREWTRRKQDPYYGGAWSSMAQFRRDLDAKLRR